MSDKKSWKNLFINNGEQNSQKEEKEVVKQKETVSTTSNATTKFPKVETTAFENHTTNSNQNIENKHVDFLVKLYEEKFEKMNQDGYDFFEYFQTVIGDINDPKAYTMAFKMGSSLNKSITKDLLISQSQFYINGINEIYNKCVSDGSTKRESLNQQKETENHNLNAELSALKSQAEAIQIQINDKQNKLSLIDSNFEPIIADIDGKLMANDFAKNKLISAIETVKQGIINNLK